MTRGGDPQLALCSRRIYGAGLDELVALELDPDGDGTLAQYAVNSPLSYSDPMGLYVGTPKEIEAAIEQIGPEESLSLQRSRTVRLLT